MSCLEKVGLVQAHFTKYTPFYAMWTYFSQFFYFGHSKWAQFLHNFSLVERPEWRISDILVYSLFFFCWSFFEVLWDLTLYTKMTGLFCEVLDVSLVICWLLWFVSLTIPIKSQKVSVLLVCSSLSRSIFSLLSLID